MKLITIIILTLNVTSHGWNTNCLNEIDTMVANEQDIVSDEIRGCLHADDDTEISDQEAWVNIVKCLTELTNMLDRLKEES